MTLVPMSRKRPAKTVNIKEMDLESVLMELERHGQPKLSQMSRGWWCRIEMNVNASGASFEVESEIRHQRPLDAAAECLYRVRKALEALS